MDFTSIVTFESTSVKTGPSTSNVVCISHTEKQITRGQRKKGKHTSNAHCDIDCAIVQIVILDHSPTVACDTGSVKIIQSATISLSQEGRVKGMMYMNHMQL